MKFYANPGKRTVIIELANHLLQCLKMNIKITPKWTLFYDSSPPTAKNRQSARLDKIKTENIPTGFPRKETK